MGDAVVEHWTAVGCVGVIAAVVAGLLAWVAIAVATAEE